MDLKNELSHCSNDQSSNFFLFRPGLTTLEGWVESSLHTHSFPAHSVPRHPDWQVLICILLKRVLHLLFPLTWVCRKNCGSLFWWVLINLALWKKKGVFCQSWHLQNIAIREGVIIKCYMLTNKIQCYIDSSKNAIRSITYSFLSLTSNSSPRYVKKRSPWTWKAEMCIYSFNLSTVDPVGENECHYN